MRLNIIDPVTLDLTGVLTQYESVQWTSTFNTPEGTFQINCSTDFIDLLQIDYYIENTEELDHIGVIKKVQVISSNQKTSLQINGVMLEKDLFSKRVVKAWIVYQDIYLTMALDSLITLCITEPPEPSRIVPNIGDVIIPKDEEIPDMQRTDYSANFPNLEDEIFNLLQSLNLGIKARINRETKKIDIEFYTGRDCTFGSNDAVVFSPERGTVLETEYIKDSSQNITDIVLIGEDNLILQAARERKENEPIIEKSLDVSSECPWPTYRVEKPEEDGGQYFRYKKFSPPPGFITNRDVWEKYAVDRIETTETLYREVISEVKVPINMEDLFNRAEIVPTTRVDPFSGAILSTPVPVSSALAAVGRNGSVDKNLPIGLLIGGGVSRSTTKAMSIDVDTEDAVFIDDPNAVKPPNQSKRTLRAAPKRKTNHLGTIKKTENVLSVGGDRGLGNSLRPPTGGRGEPIGNILEGSVGPMGEILVTQQEVTMEPYEVTTVTYETKDFLDYVYVNIGTPPSGATKIIQGSVASADVMYYENFEEVRVAEAQYRETLMKKAQNYLRTFVLSQNISVTPYYLSNIEYGKAYDLGDIVTARNSKLGYTVDLRVTQAVKTWDSKGYTLNITLGESIPTLTNRIRLIAKGGA